MPWVIGIDEAGYGPNLGPLVQAAAMARVPAFDLAGWESFDDKVRRAHEPKDHRILIDDSKKVYKPGAGLGPLKESLAGWAENLDNLIAVRGVLDSWKDHEAEYWCEGTDVEVFPTQENPLIDLHIVPLNINVVMPLRLNGIIESTSTKATALLRGYVGLVQSTFKHWKPDEAVIIFADKHGGRHYYSSLLQETFPDGWIVTEREGPDESCYRIRNLSFEVTAIFRPQADSGSISVALASMMAKYVREECMRQFNAFWAKHVPTLKPTAGYPVDAKRFYKEIEPAMKKLGIAKDAVWRKK